AGGGLQLTWWQRTGTADIASGDRTLLAGLDAHPWPGSVFYGGVLHVSVGASIPVPVTIGGSETRVAGSAFGIYGGYQLRLGLFSGRIEARAEAPDFHRTGLAGPAGV